MGHRQESGALQEQVPRGAAPRLTSHADAPSATNARGAPRACHRPRDLVAQHYAEQRQQRHLAEPAASQRRDHRELARERASRARLG
eukprot:11290939-Heterocapsa_arctica.AAC.1